MRTLFFPRFCAFAGKSGKVENYTYVREHSIVSFISRAGLTEILLAVLVTTSLDINGERMFIVWEYYQLYICLCSAYRCSSAHLLSLTRRERIFSRLCTGFAYSFLLPCWLTTNHRLCILLKHRNAPGELRAGRSCKSFLCIFFSSRLRRK